VRLRHVLNALERGTALNCLVDNFQRRSDWRAATHRVAALPLALNQIERSTKAERVDQRGLKVDIHKTFPLAHTSAAPLHLETELKGKTP
jgi:ABC-type uncharacterized transport system fused permease/ATPase subunit